MPRRHGAQQHAECQQGAEEDAVKRAAIGTRPGASRGGQGPLLPTLPWVGFGCPGQAPDAAGDEGSWQRGGGTRASGSGSRKASGSEVAFLVVLSLPESSVDQVCRLIIGLPCVLHHTSPLV